MIPSTIFVRARRGNGVRYPSLACDVKDEGQRVLEVVGYDLWEALCYVLIEFEVTLSPQGKIVSATGEMNAMWKENTKRLPTLHSSQELRREMRRRGFTHPSSFNHLTLCQPSTTTSRVRFDLLQKYTRHFGVPRADAEHWLRMLQKEPVRFALEHTYPPSVSMPLHENLVTLTRAASALKWQADYGHTCTLISSSVCQKYAGSSSKTASVMVIDDTTPLLVLNGAVDTGRKLASLINKMCHAHTLKLSHAHNIADFLSTTVRSVIGAEGRNALFLTCRGSREHARRLSSLVSCQVSSIEELDSARISITEEDTLVLWGADQLIERELLLLLELCEAKHAHVLMVGCPFVASRAEPLAGSPYHDVYHALHRGLASKRDLSKSCDLSSLQVHEYNDKDLSTLVASYQDDRAIVCPSPGAFKEARKRGLSLDSLTPVRLFCPDTLPVRSLLPRSLVLWKGCSWRDVLTCREFLLSVPAGGKIHLPQDMPEDRASFPFKRQTFLSSLLSLQ